MAALLTSERANTDKMVAVHRRVPRDGHPGPAARRQPVGHVLHAWSGRRDIRFGLAAIKNVGEGAVEAVLAARREGGPFRSLFDFCERVDLRAVNRRVVESFVKSGCFDSPRPAPRGALRRHRPRHGGGAEAPARPRAGPVEPLRDAGRGRDEAGGARADPGRAALVRGRAARLREGVARLLHHRPSPGAVPRGARAVGDAPPRARSPRLRPSGEVDGGRDRHRRCASSRPRRATAWPASSSRTSRAASRRWSSPRPTRRRRAAWPTTRSCWSRARPRSRTTGKARLLASEVLPLEQAKLADARYVTIRVPMAAWDRAQGRAAPGYTRRRTAATAR